MLLAPSCSGDQIVGATIYFDNLQSGEVTQLLNTMGHHTVGLKLHRKGDRSPEPGQIWTQEVFSSRSSEVVLVSTWRLPRAPCVPDHAGLFSLLSVNSSSPFWLSACSGALGQPVFPTAMIQVWRGADAGLLRVSLRDSAGSTGLGPELGQPAALQGCSGLPLPCRL